AVPRWLAGRGPGLLPVPVRLGQPGQVRRRRPHRLRQDREGEDRRGHGAGRPDRRRAEEVPQLLARHEAAPGDRGGPAHAPRPDHPGRADQRPRPQGTREVRALVRQIAADGITVFVSSHLLAEVEQVSTHVGVMRLGKLVFQGELAALRRTAAPRVAVRTGDTASAAEVLTKLGLADTVLVEDLVTAELGDVAPEKITAELVHAGVGVRGLTVEAPSLEDLFVGLTGEGFDVER